MVKGTYYMRNICVFDWVKVFGSWILTHFAFILRALLWPESSRDAFTLPIEPNLRLYAKRYVLCEKHICVFDWLKVFGTLILTHVAFILRALLWTESSRDAFTLPIEPNLRLYGKRDVLYEKHMCV
jgi:hypothetical protein